MRGYGLVCLVALLATTLALAQDRAASRPSSSTDTHPKEMGSVDTLKRLLAEYAAARHKNTPESLLRAAEIDRRLPDYDWSSVDVPAATFDFAFDQEQKLSEKKLEGWDFDRLPPGVVRIKSPGKWAAWLDERIEGLIEQQGSLSWKNPRNRRTVRTDMLKARAVEKITSHLATVLAPAIQTIPRRDLLKMHDALFRIYENYELDTVQRCSQYDYLQAGYYLQWGGWLGDRRAWKVATTIIDAWFAAPRDVYEPNFAQAVRAVNLYNNLLEPDREPERAALLRRIKDDPATPGPVRKLIRAP